ncbi:glycosyltransferase family 4 protein [Roseivirga sp. E12]|uniref:glycosyltransferase family 4 protein n=1 Tax=Roseivirga sp. E12 TaxID=2819237 RepID=UPI001ABC3359|nr:glycosyltransferase family 4 protein [Roseivirga sp. E12]MBO3698366.1 glycosyltransferase family 4 protein [Roseivirga sp. E12]
MKILFTHHRYHTNLFNWFRGIQLNGHEVKLLVYKPDEVDQTDLPKSTYLSPSKWSIRKMKSSLRKRGDGVDSFSPYYYPSFRTLYRYLKSEKPEIVVIRPVFSRFGYMILFMAVWFKCRVVFHNRIRIHQHYSKPKLILLKMTLGLLDAYWMSPCKGAPDKYPLASKRLIYFPFLIHAQIKGRTYFREDNINILCVAKYFKSKNPEMMLKTFLKLREGFDNIKLTICGTGDEDGAYFKNMLSIREKSPYSDDVVLLINQPMGFMEKLYMAHDIFVLPTNHDPASFTVLEAMSYGLATVTTNVDGSSGYIENGKNGFVVERGNKKMLEEKIRILLQNRSSIEEMGLKSLELVQRNHRPTKVIREFLESLM